MANIQPPGGVGASHPPGRRAVISGPAPHFTLEGAIGAAQAASDATIWNLEPSGDV